MLVEKERDKKVSDEGVFIDREKEDALVTLNNGKIEIIYFVIGVNIFMCFNLIFFVFKITGFPFLWDFFKNFQVKPITMKRKESKKLSKNK